MSRLACCLYWLVATVNNPHSNFFLPLLAAGYAVPVGYNICVNNTSPGPRDKKRSTSSARVSRRRFISLRESNKMDGRQIKQILPQTREIDESTSVYDGWNREYT